MPWGAVESGLCLHLSLSRVKQRFAMSSCIVSMSSKVGWLHTSFVKVDNHHPTITTIRHRMMNDLHVPTYQTESRCTWTYGHTKSLKIPDMGNWQAHQMRILHSRPLKRGVSQDWMWWSLDPIAWSHIMSLIQENPRQTSNHLPSLRVSKAWFPLPVITTQGHFRADACSKHLN